MENVIEKEMTGMYRSKEDQSRVSKEPMHSRG